MGLPNSGKTTYSQKFDNVLHLDDFPNSKFLNCNKAVKLQNNVVVEGIYNIKYRRELLLKGVHTEKICIWIDTPVQVCMHRNGRSKDIVLYEYISFSPPTYDEGWDKIIRVTPEGETILEH